MIDAEGKNLGVMTRDEALRLARPEEGLDLIEIVSTAKPPVARVMSFDKYRYEMEKQGKKERRMQKGGELKQVQVSARAATNDLMTKVRQLEKFLTEGHPVEIDLRLRGREKRNKDWARQKFEEFMKMITVEYKIVSDPKFGGKGMMAQIIKR